MEEVMPGLICPKDKTKLHKQSTDTLVCEEAHKYQIKNGIPAFVPGNNYADSFGVQWKKYRMTQLDSYSNTTITKDRAMRCVGDELWNSLSGKNVLECGCGAGRFTEVLLNQGAIVTSMDLSSAVDANQENFPQNETHRIIQADIGELPFETQQYDAVFCLGVVQHTPDSEVTIKNLYEMVKPGGVLIFDHYTSNLWHKLSFYTRVAPLVRFAFKRMKPENTIKYTRMLVDIFLPLHKMVRNSFLGYNLLCRISPILSFYRMYPELDEDLQKEWAMLDTHDWLTDWYKHFRNRPQIVDALKELGVE